MTWVFAVPVAGFVLFLVVGAVTGHVKVLRELGALAWVQHGTRANIRRALGLPGYAGTATVYAARSPLVIPASGHMTRSGLETRTSRAPSGPGTSRTSGFALMPGA